MAAGPGCHRDQPVRALLDRLAREAIVNDVVQRDAAPAMHRGVQVLARAQRGDDDRHLPLGAGGKVGFQPVVRFVDDLVDRERRGGAIGVRPIMRGKLFGDLMQPFVQQRLRPGVERRKGADDARLALRDHEFRPGNDEQRRTDHGQAQAVEQRGRRHGRAAPLLVIGCLAKPIRLSSTTALAARVQRRQTGRNIVSGVTSP